MKSRELPPVNERQLKVNQILMRVESLLFALTASPKTKPKLDLKADFEGEDQPLSLHFSALTFFAKRMPEVAKFVSGTSFKYEIEPPLPKTKDETNEIHRILITLNA